jgi:hypothetical protein
MLSSATLRTASGQTAGAAISDFWGVSPANVAMQFAGTITIHPPAALTGTAKVQVRAVEGGAWTDFQEAGADVTITAGKSRTIEALAAKDLRLLSSAAEGADRDFIVTIQEDI